MRIFDIEGYFFRIIVQDYVFNGKTYYGCLEIEVDSVGQKLLKFLLTFESTL